MDRLLVYGELLAEASTRLGIVARGDRDRILMRHARESVERALMDRLEPGVRILDVGSGGGLPGIPMAILRNDLSVVLLEPRERRAAFLERAILKLRLEHAAVRVGRLQDLVPGSGPGYDAVVARAIRWTPEMVEALEGLAEGPARLYRFGPRVPMREGVEIHELSSEDRVLQVWSRAAWPGLPESS